TSAVDGQGTARSARSFGTGPGGDGRWRRLRRRARGRGGRGRRRRLLGGGSDSGSECTDREHDEGRNGRTPDQGPLAHGLLAKKRARHGPAARRRSEDAKGSGRRGAAGGGGEGSAVFETGRGGRQLAGQRQARQEGEDRRF